jgi:hypothetical protein
MLTWLTSLLVATALTPTLQAQPMRDLVEAALDQQVTAPIEISERPIREALHELETATGLRFALHDLAVEWMPYGDQTRVSIVMKDVSVRRGLARIFDGLGLSLRVADDRVVIEPSPVLDRLGRRLTMEEVELLQKLASQSWSAIKPDEITIQFRLPPEGDHRRMLQQALQEESPTSALLQLEQATQRLGWLWVPAGRSIVIYSRTENVQQRLDRPLDLSYRRVPLDELLVDLGRRIDVAVHFEPGALQRVAARERQVDLIQRGINARQVLELIGGNTGLVYDVVEDGIVIGAAPAAATEPGEAKARVVAVLRVPVGTDGTTIEFLIRDDELPAEFKRLRERKLPEVIELLRRQAGD